MTKREIKPMFVRLTAAERRRIRTLAVSQGLTMREAIIQAFDAWASHLRSGASTAKPRRSAFAGLEREMAGASAGASTRSGRRPQYASTGQQIRYPAEVRSSGAGPSVGGGVSIPGFGAGAEEWIAKAAQLDWSKCSAAELVQTKKGNIWVAAGTLVPLVHVFEAVAGDNPLPEVAEVYDLTEQQLMTLLQFASEGVAGAASGS